MWNLKIKVKEKWNIYNKLTSKFKVKLYFHSQNNYSKNGRIYFIASGIISGDENSKKEFFLNLKKNKKVVNLETAGDFFVCIYSENKDSKRLKAVKIAYNPGLIFLKPVIIDEEGWEEWEIASINRQDLEDFIKYAENLENVESKLFYIKEQKITNVMFYSSLPKLTEKQKQALTLAINHGYYGYPRKVKLENLTKLMNLSISTYQFHLAKAEAKVLPFATRKV